MPRDKFIIFSILPAMCHVVRVVRGGDCTVGRFVLLSLQIDKRFFQPQRQHTFLEILMQLAERYITTERF